MRIVKGLVGLAVTEDTVARNRALQAEWYGEPLGDRIRPLLDRLGMSQSGLAGVLGLSAPMLSQLMSGRRAKISNPAVLHRLMAVEELVADPGFDTSSLGQRATHPAARLSRPHRTASSNCSDGTSSATLSHCRQ